MTGKLECAGFRNKCTPPLFLDPTLDVTFIRLHSVEQPSEEKLPEEQPKQKKK